MAARNMIGSIIHPLNGKYGISAVVLTLHLLERVEALSQKTQEQSPEFVLCHSEIYGGNALIGESGSVALPNIITCDICARIL